jgi:putative NADH-flavin reductase
MKLGRLLIAAVLLVGLSGAVWYSNKREDAKAKAPPPSTSPKILTLKMSDMRQIAFKRRDGTATTIRRNAENKWQITAPKTLDADTSNVQSVATMLSDFNSDRLVDENATDLASYGLAPPALEITVTMDDGKVSKLLLGDETPTGSGVYAKLDGDARLFTTAAANKTNLDKTYRDLRDKSMMKFDQEKFSRVELTAKKQTIEFGRVNQTEWQILKPQVFRADGLQVDELVRQLKNATMSTASDDDEKKAAAAFPSGTVVAVAKVTDPTGTETLELRKTKEDFFAKSSVVDGVQKVENSLANALEKSLDDFRNKKLFDFGFTDPTSIEFKEGDKDVAVTKTGDKWLSKGKPMDSISVQSLIDRLRDLAASNFIEAGDAKRVIELTVVSNDGKRTEKVEFAAAPSGNFIARRIGEKELYGIEKKTIEDLRQAANDVKPEQAPAGDKKK